jgi:hypothetical protein
LRSSGTFPDERFLFARQCGQAHPALPQPSGFGFLLITKIQIFGGSYENNLFGLERPVLQWD